MSLLSGPPLRDAIHRITNGSDVCCAVAFWGRGAESWMGSANNRHVRLICNLSLGGTNPETIRLLRNNGAIVRQHDRLHAKVYIGDTEAVITSANASLNGLGVEGNDLAGWIEAGTLLDAYQAQPFFDKLWKESKPISDLEHFPIKLKRNLS